MGTNSRNSEHWRAVWSLSKPGKSAAERHFAVLALGLVQAMREGLLTVKEVWENGLNFRTYLGLKERHVDRRLLELWEWAMELPQVERLGADALHASFAKMECLAWDVISKGGEIATRRRRSFKNMAAIRRRLAKEGKSFTRGEVRAAIEFGRR